jgi:hypothetical protein
MVGEVLARATQHASVTGPGHGLHRPSQPSDLSSDIIVYITNKLRATFDWKIPPLIQDAG